METANKPAVSQADLFYLTVKKRSDKLMNYFLPAYFLAGLILALFYNTWLIAIGVGGLSVLAYYSSKMLLPDSSLYQYVLGAVLGVFMAQYIYQMHGLFEMHFFAFIGSAILITYQKWKLQIPILIVVFIHHAVFSYLQDSGFDKIYFTQLDYFDLQTFIIHLLLTMLIFFICGLWAYQLHKYSQMYISQALQMAELQKEAQLSLERKQHADELFELNTNLQVQARELALSNAELEQFAYVASHDLQEPLRTITSFLTLLSKKYKGVIDQKGQQYIDFAVDGAGRMRQIIVDLLEFSKAGREGHEIVAVNVMDIVEHIHILYQKQVDDLEAKIIYNDLPVVQTFKPLLQQVLQNLVANGLKYQQPGKKTIIQIVCMETAVDWQFSVMDNGIGIDEKYFDQIFLAFRRLHTKTEYPGTGIGLAICKKIVNYLGGEIWVTSKEGKGSTFHFTIPKA